METIRWKYSLVFLLFLMLCRGVFGQEIREMGYWHHPDSNLGFEEARTQEYVPMESRAFDLEGYVESVDVWFKMNLEGAESGSKGHVLEMMARCDTMDVYFPLKGGGYKRFRTGLTLSKEERDVMHSGNAVSVPIGFNPSLPIYVHIQARHNRYFPFGLISKADYFSGEYRENFFHGVFFGWFLLWFLVMLGLYLISRERTYALFLGYTLSMVAGIHLFAGDTYEVFYSEVSGNLPTVAYPILLVLIPTFHFLFSIDFLRLKEHGDLKWLWTIRSCILLYWSFALLFFVGVVDTIRFYQLGVLFTVVVNVLLIFLGIVMMYRRRPRWLVFLVGMVFFLLAGFSHFLFQYNLIHVQSKGGFFIRHGFELCESIALSVFALSMTINFLMDRETREKEQRSRISQLHDEQRVSLMVKERLKEEVERKTQQLEVLLKEVHHRTKNNLQMILGLIHLQMDAMPENMSREALQDVEARITAMSLIHQRLYLAEDKGRIDIQEYLPDLIEELESVYHLNSQHISLEVNLPSVVLGLDKAICIGLLLNELLTNSWKYAFKDKNKGKVFVLGDLKEETLVLKIGDDGVGFDENKASKGLGMKLVQDFVWQLDAEMKRVSENGTVYEVSIPV